MIGYELGSEQINTDADFSEHKIVITRTGITTYMTRKVVAGSSLRKVKLRLWEVMAEIRMRRYMQRLRREDPDLHAGCEAVRKHLWATESDVVVDVHSDPERLRQIGRAERKIRSS